MIYLIVFYWLVCGVALWSVVDRLYDSTSVRILYFLFSVVIGGIVVPAKIVMKLVA